MSERTFWMKVYITAIRNGQSSMAADAMAKQAIKDWRAAFA